MNDTNRKIDEYLRRERFKNIAFGVLFLVFITVLYVTLIMPPLGQQSQVVGTVVTMTANQHEEGHTLKMLVKLKSGREVFVFIPQSKFYKQGEKVKLLKREPLVFGKVVYSFRGYQD
jgi:hypothetical protein